MTQTALRLLREIPLGTKGSRTALADPERRQLVTGLVLRAYQDEGASIRTICEAMGRSYGLVHQLLTEGGATLRGRGGAHNTTPGRALTDHVHQAAAARVNEHRG